MTRPSLLRRFTPVALIAASALLLASCGDDGKEKSSSDDPTDTATSASADGCGDFGSGDVSDGVKVTGEFGATQTAEFSTPLEASDIERTVLDEGDGEDTTAGQTVDALITLYLGKDGKALGSESVSLKVGDSSMIQAFTAGIDCVPLGSRVVVTAPAKDMYGEQGNPNLGIGADDSLVIVTDVIGLKEQLVPAAWKADAAKVSFDDQGKPTLKLPKGKPAKDLLLKVLRPGDGAVVAAGDSVTLDYQGTSWDTGKIFDQSYGKAPATFATDQVVEGFGAALVGQKVGTRLVVTIPPKYAYGEEGAGSELSGQTLVFVIEIKATTAS